MNWNSDPIKHHRSQPANTDEQLRELLQAWSDIEPKEDFEKDVWRRISQTTTTASVSIQKKARILSPIHFRRVAAAILVGIFMGTFFGWLTPLAYNAEKRAEDRGGTLFYGRTLTSSYTSLVKGNR